MAVIDILHQTLTDDDFVSDCVQRIMLEGDFSELDLRQLLANVRGKAKEFVHFESNSLAHRDTRFLVEIEETDEGLPRANVFTNGICKDIFIATRLFR